MFIRFPNALSHLWQRERQRREGGRERGGGSFRLSFVEIALVKHC